MKLPATAMPAWQGLCPLCTLILCTLIMALISLKQIRAASCSAALSGPAPPQLLPETEADRTVLLAPVPRRSMGERTRKLHGWAPLLRALN